MANKAKPVPLAQSPLVAVAERASEAGARHGLLVMLDSEGDVCIYPAEGTPPLLLAGMLAYALRLITDPDEPADDDE